MRPIQAQPGYTEQDSKDLMASGQFVYVEVFTITPLVGPPLLYTTAQRDVSIVPYGGIVRQIYKARELIIEGLRFKTSIGAEVDEQEIQLHYDEELRFQGALTVSNAIRQGRLDGATIRRDRVVGNSFNNWMGVMPMFTGLVSNIDKVGRMSASVKVKSDLVLLNIQMPRDLYQVTCKHTWGDAGCGIDQADYAVTGVIESGTTRSLLNWAGADDTYTMGKVHIHNMDDVTRVRTILKATDTALTLIYPLDFTPTPGMSFTAYPNCRRQYDRCFWGVDKDEHFLGFPFIPVAETAA